MKLIKQFRFKCLWKTGCKVSKPPKNTQKQKGLHVIASHGGCQDRVTKLKSDQEQQLLYTCMHYTSKVPLLS